MCQKLLGKNANILKEFLYHKDIVRYFVTIYIIISTHYKSVAHNPCTKVCWASPQIRYIHSCNNLTGKSFSNTISYIDQFLPAGIFGINHFVNSLKLQKLGDVINKGENNNNDYVEPTLTELIEKR